MYTIAWLKRTLSVAQQVFGSTSSAEIAEITILSILGMIATILVLTPGDQTFEAIYEVCKWIARCY